MAKLKLSSHIAIVLFVFTHALSMGQENNSERYKGMEVGSETRTLESKINGKKYKMYINLPEGYSTERKKEYPVFYIMDGHGYFPIVCSAYKGLLYDGLLPELIIVGLTYHGDKSDIRVLRSSDFTPTFTQRWPKSGGAKKFMDVFRNEIIPFIDNEYRTNKVNRAIGGNSFGGLITHYAPFNTPDLFNGYIICNPSLFYDNGVTFKYEEEFSKSHSKLNANVYMAVGQFDNVPAVNRMVDQINSRNYDSLLLESHVVEGMGHIGATFQAFTRGVQFIYRPRGISLEEEVLEQYVGSYEYLPGRNVNIIIHEGGLALKGEPSEPPAKLYALGNDKFSFMGNHRDFHFVRDENGKVTGYESEYKRDVMIRPKKIDK